MKTLNKKYPITETETDGVKVINVSFMSVWDRAWYWMDQWGIPIEDWQKQRISELDMSKEREPSKFSMVYFITQHCVNLKENQVPDEFKPMIIEYKIKMMDLWGWPDWGYKDIKHLKPKDGARP